jgi:hypothetical protein
MRRIAHPLLQTIVTTGRCGQFLMIAGSAARYRVGQFRARAS